MLLAEIPQNALFPSASHGQTPTPALNSQMGGRGAVSLSKSPPPQQLGEGFRVRALGELKKYVANIGASALAETPQSGGRWGSTPFLPNLQLAMAQTISVKAVVGARRVGEKSGEPL